MILSCVLLCCLRLLASLPSPPTHWCSCCSAMDQSTPLRLTSFDCPSSQMYEIKLATPLIVNGGRERGGGTTSAVWPWPLISLLSRYRIFCIANPTHSVGGGSASKWLAAEASRHGPLGPTHGSAPLTTTTGHRLNRLLADLH